MFKGIERWILYICFTIPIVIFTVLILIQRQYSWHYDQLLSTTGAHPEQILVMNELFLKTFFLVFFCFLLILFGSMVVLKEIHRIFSEPAENRVPSSIMATTPGFVMLGVGCFLLFFSIFRPPGLPFLPNLYYKGPQGSQELVQQPADTPAAVPSVASQAPPGLKQEANPSVVATKIKAPEHMPSSATPSGSVLEQTREDQDELPKQYDQPVSTEERNWAAQLEANAIKYGYYPTKADNDRYNKIYSGSGPSSSNTSNHWAFTLLQKMQDGYQPTPEEMSRYENIISSDLSQR
jgi:hypothetical protein